MLDDELEFILTDFDMWAMNHGLEWAEENLRRRYASVADYVIGEYRLRIGEPIHAGLVAEDHEAWYLPKPDHEMPRWSYAKTQLGLPPEVVDKTSRVADEILARLSSPLSPSITTRGLVLGHVQSGKTTSFLSVAAKAADVGYDLIVVLAGVHNSLRRQTQDRAARTLVHKRSLWWLGTAVGDFKQDGNSLATHLAGRGKRGLLVVKKHSTILRRLADWLEDESDASLRKIKILVIDDEADQAGLDVSSTDELQGVHKQLFRIVNLRTSNDERRCTYLAYTATPYANILTSQTRYGLYPRDFIYPLEKPSNYIGAEELFGDARVGRPVRIEEDGGHEILTDALQDAIRWFVLATAARAALNDGVDSIHSSMLIHTTQRTDEQLQYRPVIEDHLQLLLDEFRNDETPMQRFYDTSLAQVPARPGGGEGFLDEVVATWPEVRAHVATVLGRLLERTPATEPYEEDGRKQQAHSGVIVDNSKVDWTDRLTYSDLEAGQPGVTVIAIGGNTLSRGLTLEGLVCSYFARTARTYDSLMQMGRWFGYRPGYRHLLRIWTTQDLLDWFQELNQVEQELRSELEWMEEAGFTPDEYGPRIRVSPNMNITRASAMRSVSRHVSYSDYLIDPGWLDLDHAVLLRNQELARELAAGLGPRADDDRGLLLFRDVPVAAIRRFLSEFGFHASDTRIDRPSLLKYLDAEVSDGRLRTWNVLFKSLERGPSEFDYGGPVGVVGTVRRARLADASVAHIQSLVDSSDHRLDMEGSSPAGDARYRSADEPPLLVVYAVDPISEPNKGGNRVRLDAATTPISASVTFPRSESFVEYVSPVLDAVDLDLGDYSDV